MGKKTYQNMKSARFLQIFVKNMGEGIKKMSRWHRFKCLFTIFVLAFLIFSIAVMPASAETSQDQIAQSPCQNAISPETVSSQTINGR